MITPTEEIVPVDVREFKSAMAQCMINLEAVVQRDRIAIYNAGLDAAAEEVEKEYSSTVFSGRPDRRTGQVSACTVLRDAILKRKL